MAGQGRKKCGAKMRTVDLSSHLNWPRRVPKGEFWQGLADRVREFPEGAQTPWGIPFDMAPAKGPRAVLAAKGRRETIVPLSGKATHLCFLHGWYQLPEDVCREDPTEGLVVADCFIVPVTPDYLALEGLVNLMEAVERIRAGIGKVAASLGILLTSCDYRMNATGEIIELIRRHYGRLVFRTEIRSNVRLKEAPSFGKTIFDFAAKSAGAECYRKLVREVIRRVS